MQRLYKRFFILAIEPNVNPTATRAMRCLLIVLLLALPACAPSQAPPLAEDEKTPGGLGFWILDFGCWIHCH